MLLYCCKWRGRRNTNNNGTIDNLTGIGNSLHLQQNYLSYIKSHQNTQLIMIDVENFKPINDTFGHNIGDLYLKTVAQLLTKNFSNSLVIRVHLYYSNINRTVDPKGILLPALGDIEITLSPVPEYSMLKSLSFSLASLVVNPITFSIVLYLVSK